MPATSSGPPSLITETRLMQQYRVASATHGGGDLAAIRNAQGGVDVFTIGTDGSVSNFYPDPASDTGYSNMDTGLVASAIAVGLGPDGNVIVFAANNVALNYVVGTGQIGPGRWGAVQEATLPRSPTATAIARIYAETIGGALHVGVLTRIDAGAPSPSYAFAYSRWSATPGQFTATDLVLSSLNCLWTGPSAAGAQFDCLDGTCLTYSLASGATGRLNGPSFQSLSVDSATDAGGTAQIFAVLADGNLNRLSVEAGSYAWTQLTSSAPLREVQAVADADGAIHLFALGANAETYHLAPLAGDGWGSLAPIWTRSALMAMTRDGGGNVELFLVGTGQGALTRMIREGTTGDWHVVPLEVATAGKVEEMTAYCTDIAISDVNGGPIPFAVVEIRASAQTQLTLNGATYVVDPVTPALLTANAAGQLSVTQETMSLGVPTLEVTLPRNMPADTSLAVRQYAGVQQRLAEVTADELLAATDSSGQPLLPAEYRTLPTASAFAQASAQCMALANSTAARIADSRRSPGVGHCPRGSAAQLNRIRPPAGMSSWQLDFSSGQAVFRVLSQSEAHALIADKKAQFASPDGFLHFLGELGDVIIGVGRQVVRVVDTIVTAVHDTVEAAITFVIDETTYIFNTVVHYVEHAFDLVQAFFARVGVSFRKAFEWLGYVFNWNDILRTHRAAGYVLQQYLAFLPLAAEGLKAKVDSGIGQAGTAVDAYFAGLVGRLGGSLGGFLNTNRPANPNLSTAMANNIVLNGFIDNAAAARSTSSTLALVAADPATDPLTALIAALRGFGSGVEAVPAFTTSADYMQSLSAAPDQIFQQLLTLLLQVVRDVIKGVLNDVKAIADGLVDALAALAAALGNLLSATWDIPFVTPFYKWLTDSELTLLDLLTLILAIPATILFKAIRDTAPFPTDASVTAFEASFTAQTILEGSGLGAGRSTAAAAAASLPSGGALTIDILGFLATAVGGFMSAALDWPVRDPPKEATKPLAYTGVTLSLFGQVTSIPGLMNSGTWDCKERDGANNWIWICETLGVGIDLVYTVMEQHYAEQGTDGDVLVAFGYGIAHILTVAAAGEGLSTADVVTKVAAFVPETAKLLRLERLETQTGNQILAGLDILGALTAAFVGFVDSLSPDDAARFALARVPGAVPRS